MHSVIADQQRVFQNSLMPKRAPLSRLSDALESASRRRDKVKRGSCDVTFVTGLPISLTGVFSVPEEMRAGTLTVKLVPEGKRSVK